MVSTVVNTTHVHDRDLARRLDNPVWAALTGPQADLAEGEGQARRYDPDVALFTGMEAAEPAAWADLARVVGPGGVAALFQDIGDPPEGWKEIFRFPTAQMVAPETLPPAMPVEGVTWRDLGAPDVAAMVALTRLTEPGPFLDGTHRMGRYVGAFDGDRLVAMAGERMRVAGATEISAVCTHPDARGRGLAAWLTLEIAHGIAARGERPVLHVLVTNVRARSVYDRLGFTERRVADVLGLLVPS